MLLCYSDKRIIKRYQRPDLYHTIDLSKMTIFSILEGIHYYIFSQNI